MSQTSLEQKDQRPNNKRRRKAMNEDTYSTPVDTDPSTPSTSSNNNTHPSTTPQPLMNNSKNNEEIPTEGTENQPIIISDKNQALFKTINKITTKMEKAKHHKSFLTSHIDKGTTPRGLVPNINCQIPDISPELHLEWENTLTNTGKSLCGILINYWNLRVTTLQAQFDTYFLQLESQCNPQELTTVNRILDNLRTTIQQDLVDRRNKKDPSHGDKTNSS